VSEVQRNTGYALHLFDEEEKTSANIKDKAAKVRYLTKIIACVAIDSEVGSSPDVLARPLKIVAGLEPERTNAFLQALARCAKRGDGESAARRARNGETNETSAAASVSEVASREKNKVAPPPSAPSTSFDPFAGGTDETRARAASTVSSTPAEAKNEKMRRASRRRVR
jgi:TRAF3-interacting protein 1